MISDPSQDFTALTALSSLSTTLPNGVRIVAVPLPSVHRIAMVAHLRVGSRYETRANNGISHLLEHMLYRGIPGFPTAHEQALAFESLGGTLAAATGSDSGSMAIACPAENFERTLELFVRAYREPLLGGLDVEKRIVREEILEDLDEDGTLIDGYDLLRAMAFDGHPLGLPVIGTVQQVEAFDVDSLRRHHEKHYVGAGSVIALAGPFDAAAVTRLVADRFETMPRGELASISPPPPQAGPRTKVVRYSSSQTSLRVGFRGPGAHDAMEPATELVLRILDDGNSTRLYTRICDERGLAYDVAAGYEASDDVGLFDVGCDTAHERTDAVLTEIFDVVRDLRDGGPNQTELDKAKARHRWGLTEMIDDCADVAEYFADSTLRGYATSPAMRRERIEAVTIDEVRVAAQRLFVRDALNVVVVGTQSKRGQATLAGIIDAFR